MGKKKSLKFFDNIKGKNSENVKEKERHKSIKEDIKELGFLKIALLFIILSGLIYFLFFSGEFVLIKEGLRLKIRNDVFYVIYLAIFLYGLWHSVMDLSRLLVFGRTNGKNN